jgi:hypothetical protein
LNQISGFTPQEDAVMEKTNKFSYKVVPGEQVTVVFTPIQVGPLVAFAVDGQALTNTGGNTPTFKFTITKSSGLTHFGRAHCDFPTGTGDQAKYTCVISGSLGGSFEGPTVPKNDPTGEFGLNWDVIAAFAPAEFEGAKRVAKPAKAKKPKDSQDEEKPAKRSARKASAETTGKDAKKASSKTGSKKR